MNKTKLAITSAALTLLFGVGAIVLAHRDSRNESKPQTSSPGYAVAPAKPISIPWKPAAILGGLEATDLVSQAEEELLVVRGNDDPPASSTPATPPLQPFPFTRPPNPGPAAAPSASVTSTALPGSPANRAGTLPTLPMPSPPVASSASTQAPTLPSGNPAAQPTANRTAFPSTSPSTSTNTSLPSNSPLTGSAMNGTGPSVAGASATLSDSETTPKVAQLPSLPDMLRKTRDGLQQTAQQTAQGIDDTVGSAIRALDPNANPPDASVGNPATSPAVSSGSSAGLSDAVGGPTSGLNRPNNPRVPVELPPSRAPIGLPSAGTPAATPNTPSANLQPATMPGSYAANPPEAAFGSPQPITNRTNNSPPSSFRSGAMADSGDRPGFGNGLPSSSASSQSSNLFQLASASPGERAFEGSQTPTLQIFKRAPEEVRVGRPATFSLVVRNTGTTTAHDVRVFDRLPRGTEFSNSVPEISPTADGLLTWELGNIPPGNERIVQLEVVPQAEGEIGSVATVSFASLASVRTISTQARLDIEQISPVTVLYGDRFVVKVKVTNQGTGVARGLSLEATIPTLLRCTAGSQIVASCGDLAPGKSEIVDLPLSAVEPGNDNLELRAISEDAQPIDLTVPVSVQAPQLHVDIQGPTRRFLERPATYKLLVENSGNAAATNVEMMAQLPKSFRFNGANLNGQYDPSRHAVLWSLEELPAGEPAAVELTIIPTEAGNQTIQFAADADLGAKDQKQFAMTVEGQSELTFSIEDDNDPVEVDGLTTYTVRINNNGNRADETIQLSVEFPGSADIDSDVDAPVPSQIEGNRLVFAPIPRMNAGEQATFRFSVRWSAAETQVLRARVTSKNRSIPVTQEEATEVYLDR